MSSPAIDLLAALPFNRYLGLTVVRADETGGEVHMPERKELENHIGSQHAGALFTVAEAASGAAILGAFAAQLGEMTPLAREATIAYVKVARGPIAAKATLERDRATVLAELKVAERGVDIDVGVVLFDPAGVECVKVTVKWYLKKHR